MTAGRNMAGERGCYAHVPRLDSCHLASEDPAEDTTLDFVGLADAALETVPAPPPPSHPRTKWTRRVPHPVLIGHAAS